MWTWSCLFSYCTTISMANSFKKDQSKIRSFNWHRYVISGRKKVLEEEYFTLFIDIQKLILNTWKIMIKLW